MAGKESTMSRLNQADLDWLASLDAPKPDLVKREEYPCGDCAHFEPNPINPPSGVGRCRGIRDGEAIYPGEQLKCRGWNRRTPGDAHE